MCKMTELGLRGRPAITCEEDGTYFVVRRPGLDRDIYLTSATPINIQELSEPLRPLYRVNVRLTDKQRSRIAQERAWLEQLGVPRLTIARAHDIPHTQ